MIRNMKIGVRLIISSVVFLVPLGIMLFFIVAGANTSIQTAEREQRGLSCLRSIAELLRIASMDPGNIQLEIVDSANVFLQNLEREYAAIGAAGPEGEVLVKQIGNDFMILWNTGWDVGGVTHQRIIENLKELFLQIGDEAALFMASGRGDYYLLNAGIRGLPQSWERISQIGNLLRLSQGQAGLSAYDRKTAGDYLVLLAHADYSQVLSDIDTALSFLADEGFFLLNSSGADEIFSSLASYRSSLDWFIASAQAALSLNREGAFAEARSNALKAEVEVIENSYTIMNACFDKLEISLQRRIDSQRQHLLRSLGLVLLASVLALGITIFSNIHISRSTAQFRGLFAVLEQNDLSVKAAVESNDELGELMTAFNGFLEKLRGVFDSINQDMSMLSSAVFDLSASAKEISTTASEQSSSVAEILSTMEGNKNLSAQGAAKTQEVAELAAKTQELSRRGADLRDANQDMMSLIRDQNGKIIDEINGLADMLSRINESIALIDSIADQTKLIAFNASLEAAAPVNYAEGLGEESARFSVVAAEIRRFADNVVDSTTEIKEQMQEVQHASQNLIEEANNGRLRIDEGYERMVRQKEVFEQIVEVSRNVADRSQQISTLSRQQEYASAQIFIALKEISAGVNQFVTATVSMSKITEDLNLMSAEQRKILAKYWTGKAMPGDKQEPGE